MGDGGFCVIPIAGPYRHSRVSGNPERLLPYDGIVDRATVGIPAYAGNDGLRAAGRTVG